jgi:hypothetical protein
MVDVWVSRLRRGFRWPVVTPLPVVCHADHRLRPAGGLAVDRPGVVRSTSQVP